MKVLLASEALTPRTGPVMRVLGFSKALEEAGHQVVLVSPGTTDSNSTQGSLRVIRYHARTRIGRYRGMVSSVQRAIREFKPDVVQATSYYAPVLLGLAHLESLPTVNDYHASMRVMERNTPIHIINILVEMKSLDLADTTIVPTRALSQYLLERYGRATVVIPNCVDIRDFEPIGSKPSVLKDLGVTGGKKAIFFHGSLYPENVAALGRLIKIVEKVNERGVPAVALVAGALPVLPSEFVRYLGYREDLIRCISSADIAILPVTITEMGLRSRVIEYLACGLSVVTTPSGATEFDEAVKRGIVSVGKSDNELIDAALQALGRSPSENRRISEEARRFVEERFSLSRSAHQLERVYMNAIRLHKA